MKIKELRKIIKECLNEVVNEQPNTDLMWSGIEVLYSAAPGHANNAGEFDKQHDIRKYVRQSKSSGDNESYRWSILFKFPKKKLFEIFKTEDFDLISKKIKRAAKEELEYSGGPGQSFSRGHAEAIVKNENIYIRITCSGGRDI